MEESYGRNLIVAIGGDLKPLENRKAWIFRVARFAGISERLVSGAFYRERISRETEEALQRAIIEKKKNDDYSLATRVEVFAAEWETIDPVLYGSHVCLFRQSASLIRELAASRKQIVVFEIEGEDSPDEEQGAA